MECSFTMHSHVLLCTQPKHTLYNTWKNHRCSGLYCNIVMRTGILLNWGLQASMFTVKPVVWVVLPLPCFHAGGHSRTLVLPWKNKFWWQCGCQDSVSGHDYNPAQCAPMPLWGYSDQWSNREVCVHTSVMQYGQCQRHLELSQDKKFNREQLTPACVILCPCHTQQIYIALRHCALCSY